MCECITFFFVSKRNRRRGHDCMVVVNSNLFINLFSDLPQIGGFLRVQLKYC